ncbi:MAG: hypothetical protein GY705_24750, partial [Bacteroidetes bacterium]|nr:hypothetical protein [Bacteroidota bacterium]
MKKFTLLIVDDEEPVINSLKRFFALFTYYILVALNGEKALGSLDATSVDLLILGLYLSH